MKAIQLRSFGPPLDVVHIIHSDPGPPDAGEAIVEVLATPINPSDVLMLQGLYGTLPTLPAIPGNEGVGRVVALADGETSVKVGDVVFLPLGSGTWRTHLRTKAAWLIVAPPGADPKQLAMMAINPPTADLILRQFVKLEKGDWVIQNAANSAVGRYLIALARREGYRTINVVRRAELEPELSALGADVVLVDGEDLAKRVRQATGGAPVKLGVDAVGGSGTLRIADATANGGTVVCYGVMSGKAPMITPAALVFRDVALRGFWLTRPLQTMSRDDRRLLFERIANLIADGTLVARVDSTYPLERIREALARSMEEGRGGKVLLTPNGDV